MNQKLLLYALIFLLCSCKNNETTKATTSSVVKEEQMAIKSSCGYSGIASVDKVYSFISDDITEKYVSDIMKIQGLPQNFKVKAIDVNDNAFATIVLENELPVRYILYSQEFFEGIKNKTKSNYSIKSILAHEIGHHLCGHTLQKGGSRPLEELEADRFSGFAMRKMGSTLDEALCAIKSFGTMESSTTHPSSNSRIAAITNGWKAADEQYPETATTIKQTDKQTIAQNHNNFNYTLCNMGIYPLAVRNKIMTQAELNIANSSDIESKNSLNANTLIGIISDGQEFDILEKIDGYLKIQTVLVGQNIVGYIPSKVFGKKIYCEVSMHPAG